MIPFRTLTCDLVIDIGFRSCSGTNNWYQSLRCSRDIDFCKKNRSFSVCFDVFGVTAKLGFLVFLVFLIKNEFLIFENLFRDEIKCLRDKHNFLKGSVLGNN